MVAVVVGRTEGRDRPSGLYRCLDGRRANPSLVNAARTAPPYGIVNGRRAGHCARHYCCCRSAAFFSASCRARAPLRARVYNLYTRPLRAQSAAFIQTTDGFAASLSAADRCDDAQSFLAKSQ